MNEVLKAIADRRSIRSYTDEPLTDDQLNALINAAQQAPSAVNRQPYHFTFVRNAALLREFSEDYRKIAAAAGRSFEDPNFDVLRGATSACFIFAVIPYVFTPVDCGIAVENLALAAHSMGLGSVILGMPRDIFNSELKDKWLKKLDVPEGGEFAIAIGIGVPRASKEAHPVREGLVTVID